jgi:hypothetical protein
VRNAHAEEITMNHEQDEALERMIDDHGLAAVLASLIEACQAKAEHLRSNWQDDASASVWDVAAKRLERAETFAREVGL